MGLHEGRAFWGWGLLGAEPSGVKLSGGGAFSRRVQCNRVSRCEVQPASLSSAPVQRPSGLAIRVKTKEISPTALLLWYDSVFLNTNCLSLLSVCRPPPHLQAFPWKVVQG